MTQVILAIHLMVVIALIIVILYQKSEGGALGMGGGQGGVFTGRGQANALTRATGILATAFFLTSIALTVIPAWQRRVEGGGDWTKAINQGDAKVKEIKPGEKAPVAPESGKDSIFDQLQRAQQQRQQQDAPASAPAPTPAAPAAVAPKVEAPKVEAPKAEAPKATAPATVAPKVEAPKAAAPAATAPAAAPAEPPPVKWTTPSK
jgi:protein translocase SecG subunit